MENKKVYLSQKILNYLGRYPQAGDSLEGIAKWWLEMQCIEESVEDVADALNLLIRQGNIRTRTDPSGSTIFKIKDPDQTFKG